MNNQILRIVGVAIVLVLAGIFTVNISTLKNKPQSCTAEAKICPDGTAVGRTGPNCEFAACPNGDAMFDQTGVVTVNNPGAPGIQFVYEAPGSPALTKVLAFDGESMCVFSNGTTACISMNTPLETVLKGKRVRVTGIDRGADLLVRRIEVLPENTGEPEAQLITVSTKLDRSASGIGVTITAQEITEDSRCPADVQCIWAGTVKVKATLSSSSGTSNVVFELGKSISTAKEFVTLVEVAPAKKSPGEIAPESYVLTFEIRKR